MDQYSYNDDRQTIFRDACSDAGQVQKRIGKHAYTIITRLDAKLQGYSPDERKDENGNYCVNADDAF